MQNTRRPTGSGLTPKKVPQTLVAGTAESELAHATEFYSAVVYASEFTTLWTQLRATRARIDLTPRHGYIVRPSSSPRIP